MLTTENQVHVLSGATIPVHICRTQTQAIALAVEYMAHPTKESIDLSIALYLKNSNREQLLRGRERNEQLREVLPNEHGRQHSECTSRLCGLHGKGDAPDQHTA